MTSQLEIATPWGASHHHSDLDGPVHWIHWAGPGTRDAQPPMMLVHGLGGSHANWLDVGRIWAADREVFALDVRGFGLTPGFPANTSIFANRDLVIAFLEQVVGRPAVLMGNSMGGMISTFVARARPDLVTELVLIDPALPPDPGARPDPQVLSRFALFSIPGVAERAMRKARESVPAEVIVRQLAELVYADLSRANPDVTAATIEIVKRRSSDASMGDLDRSFTTAARSLLRIIAQRSRYAAHLAALTPPVLLIHGDRDRLVSASSARRSARGNPSWTFVEFDGVGHVPQMEVPELTARTVSDWLTRAEAAA